MNFLGAHDIIDLISKYLCLAGVLAQIPICLSFLFFFSGCILAFHFFKIIADDTFFVYLFLLYIYHVLCTEHTADCMIFSAHRLAGETEHVVLCSARHLSQSLFIVALVDW